MTPLTASDEQEFNASYSPNGNYLVFNRYMGQCESHLWAKDLRNNQEQRLSTEPGHYSELSWSADSAQLTFVLQSECSDAPENLQMCWQLQTLDFAQAWNGNANGLTRYDCEQTKTTHPTWLNDGRIALLQYSESDNKKVDVVIYDAVANQLSRVPLDINGRIYSLTYSRLSNVLATASVNDSNEHRVNTFSINGEILNETLVNLSAQYSVYDSFPLSFSPDGEHFLTNIEGKIYRLSMSGDLERVHPDSFSGFWTPTYHPNQSKIAVTVGSKDFDIGTLNIVDSQPSLEGFARSTATEARAQFQPNGDLIAFFSRRSGTGQIWIKDQDRSFQLTQFTRGIKGSRFSWSPNGESLAVNLDHQIALVNLDGSYQMIDMDAKSSQMEIAIDLLMPWTKQDNILVTDNQRGLDELFSVDTVTGEVTDLKLQNVLWAAYTEDNHVVYVDRQHEFWLLANEVTRALPLPSQMVLDTNFLLKNGTLYGIDSQAQLWRYHIQNDKLQMISNLSKDILYISDIRGEQMLATKFIGGRRELVELSAL